MMSTIRKEAELVAVTMALILASPAASRAQKPEDEVQTPETSRSARQPAPEPPQAQTPPEEKTQKIPDEDVREQNRPITGSELEDADFPGSWPMFGQKARMKIGGYVKADFLYDFDGTLDRTQFLMSTIPVEGTPESANSGYVSFFARESRFNVDVRRVEEGKAPLRLFLEGDFWSSGNQFRLRHAYVVFGNFLAGQTWTNLSALESLPVLIDFAAGDALFGGRTTQLRYQRQVKERWKLSASVENLDFMGIENPLGLSGEPSAALPLVSLRAD